MKPEQPLNKFGKQSYGDPFAALGGSVHWPEKPLSKAKGKSPMKSHGRGTKKRSL